MQDWQAALAAYIIALLVADTEAAPLAVVMAWALAIEQVVETASKGIHPLQDLFAGQPTQQLDLGGGQAPITIPAHPTPVPVQGTTGTVP